MHTPVRDRDVIAVVRLLDEAAQNNRRAKSSQPRHRRGLYKRKDATLAKALVMAPEQFIVDSIERETPLTVGLTHRFSPRRVHVQPGLMPPEVQAILAELPRAYEQDVLPCGPSEGRGWRQ